MLARAPIYLDQPWNHASILAKLQSLEETATETLVSQMNTYRCLRTQRPPRSECLIANGLAGCSSDQLTAFSSCFALNGSAEPIIAYGALLLACS